MSTLTDLVRNNIPKVYQMRYDFTNHWIPWVNTVLNLIPQMVKLPDNVIEFGVPVVADRWIIPPKRCRKPISIYTYNDPNSFYDFEQTNKKLKLLDGFTSVSVPANIMWVDSLTVDITEGGVLNDYEGALLVTGGESFIVQERNSNRLTLLHEAETHPAVITAELYSSDNYLLLKCVADYLPVTAPTDEVPLSDKYEKAIAVGLRLEIQKEMEDLSQINLWMTLMRYELGLLDLDSGLLKKLKSLTREEPVQDASKT